MVQMGYELTDELEEADAVLYNTCAVRENAEDRVLGNIGALKHYKRRNPSMVIGLCGCMTQQQPVADKIKKELSPCGSGFRHLSRSMPCRRCSTMLSTGGRVLTCLRGRAFSQRTCLSGGTDR